MTGNEFKIEIKRVNLKQEDVAKKLGITVRTLQNWFALDELDANAMQLIGKIIPLNEIIDAKADSILERQQRTIEVQAETINRQSRIIEALTIK